MNIFDINLDNPCWAQIESLLPVSSKMLNCPQNPVHHAEGDVWTHTKMCINSLINDKDWSLLSPEDKFINFFALLLHDIGKPLTTKIENGVITAKGHSAVGSIDARIWLYKQSVDFQLREKVCAVISYHQLPFFILEKENFQLLARTVGWLGIWDNLLWCAKHDMLGRVCVDQKKHIDNLEFLNLYLDENGLKHPVYVDSYTRLRYLLNPETVSPEYSLHKEKNFDVYLMTGLPGSGKDTYIKNHLSSMEHISFDDERQLLGLSVFDNGSAVVHKSYDKMKLLLAKKKSFVFNATNLSRNLRQKPLDLFHKYGATVNIVYMEKCYEQLLVDDKKRGDKSVGEKVISSMLFKWEPPSVLEAENTKYNIIKNDKKYYRTI